LLAAVATLWPGRISGPLDGAPLGARGVPVGDGCGDVACGLRPGPPCKRGSIGALLVAIPLAAGCSKNSTSTPTSPTTRATGSIAAISVVGERASAGGYTYRVVLHLRESAGVAATISAADLTFMNGASTVMSSRHEQTIPSTANVVPANGVADTREL